MSDMSEAMKVTGALAAQTGVKIDELSAFIGTATATTKKSGSEIGTAFKSIFTNLQNISSDKIINTLNEAGASMTVMKDGIEQLRTPTEILKDLAKTYNSLEARDPLKQKITTNIGGKYFGSILSATLTNFDQYEKMLNDYAEADNTAYEEMVKTRESWQGKLNNLGSAFSKTLKNFANTDMIKGFLDVLTGVANGLDVVTSKLGGLGTVAATVGIVELVRNFTNLKTTIEGLRNIQGIANEINAIPVLLDGATKSLKPEIVAKYVSSLQGLSLEQAKIALSTSQLTEAQKAQILTQAGLTASNEAISGSMVAQAMAESGLTTAKQEEVLINAGLMTSDTKVGIASATCTKAKLEEALATAGVTGANAQAIISNTGLTASNTSTSISFGVLTASVKANIAAMATWLATNPIGWAILAGTAIFGAVKAFDALTVSLEEQKEKMKDAQEAFSNANEEVSNVTNELKENQKAVDELLAKPNLTYADESELERLKQITNELKLQKDAAEEVRKETATSLGEETQKTFNKEFGNLDNAVNDNYNPDAPVIYSSADSNKAVDLIPRIMAYQKQYKEELDNGNIDIANSIKDTINSMSEALKSGDYAEALQTLSDEKQNMLKILDFRELTESEQDTLNQIEQWQKNIYSIVNPNKWNAIEFDSIFDVKGAERTKEELIALAQAGKLDSETIGQWTNLSKAIQDANLITENGVTNTEEFINQIVAYANGAKNAISEAADEANNVVTGFDIGEDNWKAVDTFANHLDAFKKALSGDSLNTSEIMNLMETAPSADWSSYLNGVKSLKEVLYDFSNGELEELSNQFPDLADSMQALFGETFGSAKASTEDLISSLDKLAGAFGSLEKAYKETEQKGFQSLSADAMSNLKDKFGNLDGWDDFFKTITEGNPTIEQTRDAISRLSNEYIDNCGLVQNLTEANKNYAIQQLEANGITNAAEVINSRLAIMAEAAAQGINDLGLASLDAGYSAEALANMTGEEVGQLYLQLQAAGYDSEALAYLAEMKGWVNSNVVDTSADNSNLGAEEEQSYNTASALDTYTGAKVNSNSVTVQTSSDISNQSDLATSSDRTSGYLEAYGKTKEATNKVNLKTSGDIKNLEDLANASVQAANVVSKAMGSIRQSKMTAASLQQMSQQAAQSGVGGLPKDYLSNPIANYKNTPQIPKAGAKLSRVSFGGGNASNGGGGSMAKYKPSSSGSGGSKGGGKKGSGSKKKGASKSDKDTTEIFDWVETRLEMLKTKTQNIAKAITDTVSKAFKKAQLKKQISSITDEINANNKAYDTYMKKANKVGLNKKYRDLVKNGNVNSIESIKDEKLQEKIKEYQKWYSAAKDCKEAVADLKREQQELNETLYNMPNEVAEEKIESLAKKNDVLSNKLAVADLGASGTAVLNRYADTYVSNAKKSKDKAYDNRKTAEKNFNSAKKKASKVKLNKSQKAALKAGKKIDTKGLSKKDKKIIDDYNSKLSKYNSAKSAYSSASTNYSIQKEYANSVKYSSGNEWQLQNRVLEQQLSNKKSQVSVYKSAYDETTKKLKTLKKGNGTVENNL